MCDNSGLQSITIPHSVTQIGMAAFSSCDALETIYYEGTLTEWTALKEKYNVSRMINNRDVELTAPFSEASIFCYSDWKTKEWVQAN